MGNAIACQTLKPSSKKQDHKDPIKPQGTEYIKINLQVPLQQTNKHRPSNQSSQLDTTKQLQNSESKIMSNNCARHPDESIRAICMTPDCPHQTRSQNMHLTRMLCSECLIEHTCPTKIKCSDFVKRLRSLLPKDTLDVFMEIFDDNNQVKLDAEKALV